LLNLLKSFIQALPQLPGLLVKPLDCISLGMAPLKFHNSNQAIGVTAPAVILTGVSVFTLWVERHGANITGQDGVAGRPGFIWLFRTKAKIPPAAALFAGQLIVAHL
jgi:hypothetical protein